MKERQTDRGGQKRTEEDVGFLKSDPWESESET